MHLSNIIVFFSCVPFFWSLFLVSFFAMLYDSFISFSFHPSISDKKQEMRSCNSPLNSISCGFHKFVVSPYQEVILFHSTTSPCSIVYFGFYYFQLSQSPTRKSVPASHSQTTLTFVFLQVISSVGCTTCSHLHSRNESSLVSRNVRKLPNFTYIF